MKFNTEDIAYFINEIRNKKLSDFDPINGTFHLGIAVLEYDWIDIELNLQSESNDDGDGYIDKAVLSYFCYVKGIGDDGYAYWCDAGYLDDFGLDVDVDWSCNDWEEQLRYDMETKLAEFASYFDLKYDEPNWVGDKNEYDVFYRINN